MYRTVISIDHHIINCFILIKSDFEIRSITNTFLISYREDNAFLLLNCKYLQPHIY